MIIKLIYKGMLNSKVHNTFSNSVPVFSEIPTSRIFIAKEKHLVMLIKNIKKNLVCPFQPSWRHLPHLDDKTMITYRASDIHFSWKGGEEAKGAKPRVCGYVKEGQGRSNMNILIHNLMQSFSF